MNHKLLQEQLVTVMKMKDLSLHLDSHGVTLETRRVGSLIHKQAHICLRCRTFCMFSFNVLDINRILDGSLR